MMVVTIAAVACTKPRAATTTTTTPADVIAPKSKVKLAVLAVESDKFPKVAKAATESLAKAQVTGIDETEISKVSVEVVQLSIECVEPTAACYQAVGRSLAANQLLFAQIVPGKKRALRVTITLFDVEAGSPRTAADHTFASEREAAEGLDGLVAKATQP